MPSVSNLLPYPFLQHEYGTCFAGGIPLLSSRKARNHMKPSAFDYIHVDTVDEALSVLADSDLEAKVLAGGQSLLPMLNMRLAQPKALVDINRLAALATLGQLETNLAGVAARRVRIYPARAWHYISGSWSIGSAAAA